MSNYPAAYSIESFCLGHTNFISSLAIVNNDLLISGSGDGCIRTWAFKTGTPYMEAKIDTILGSFPSNEDNNIDKNIPIEIKYSSKYQCIAVISFIRSCILFYQIDNTNPSFPLTFLNKLEHEETSVPLQAEFDNSGNLWVGTGDKVLVYQLSEKDNAWHPIIPTESTGSTCQLINETLKEKSLEIMYGKVGQNLGRSNVSEGAWKAHKVEEKIKKAKINDEVKDNNTV